jgi:RNA-directed DNA polymerase
MLSRYADDLVCAFRFCSDAEWLYQALPKRLGKFTLAVAPEKTRLLRFSRVHPGMTRRFTCWGVEFCWTEDRQGVPRVKRRTARKKLQGACQRIKEWIRPNRHLPGHAFFQGLNARLRGHYRYYGVHGTPAPSFASSIGP